MEPEELKIDNNVVYTTDKQSKKWVEATSSILDGIKRLANRLVNIKYSGKNTYDNIVFEKEVIVGAGSVKSFKDNDGDFTIMYKGVASKNQEKFNEDEAFGINDTFERVAITTNLLDRPVNHWGGSEAKGESAAKSVAQGGNRKTKEIEPRSGSKKAQQCARKSVSGKSAGIHFKKRESTINFEDRMKLKNKMNHLFFSCRVISDIRKIFGGNDMKDFNTKVSFQRKGVKRTPCPPGMAISQCKYENAKRIPGTAGSNFYIQIVQAPEVKDDFEERLIKAIDA